MTANQIAYQRNLETARANRASEVETKRHNLAGEGLGIKTLLESQRHNRVTETETNRSNLAREMETTRSNLAKEAITSSYNQAMIAQGWNSLAETSRANQAREDETYRSNLAREVEARSARWQQDEQFNKKLEQDKEISDLDREQRDRANTRSGFVSLLNTGVNAVSGMAQSILRTIGGI